MCHDLNQRWKTEESFYLMEMEKDIQESESKLVVVEGDEECWDSQLGK